MIRWIVFNILLLTATVSADSFSSLASLNALIGAEGDIPVMINSYVEKELERLDFLKKLAKEVQEHNNKAVRDGLQAVTHPINAFLFIKGMAMDWKKVIKVMRSNSADDFIRNVTRERIDKHINYPTKEDLEGAVSAGDCFEIGRAAYDIKDYYHTILWMQEARERVQNETRPTANSEEILEYLAFALYKQGNLKRALLLTDELYRMNPDHPRAKNNVKWYENLLKDQGVQPVDMRRKVPLISNPRDQKALENSVRNTYEALCRNEVPINTKEQSRLYCYYKMDRPYLRLAPFKVEIVRLNPLAVLIHEIISEEESRMIEMLAVPKACLVLQLLHSLYTGKFQLRRATVHNSITGKLETASYRISKSAWLKSWEHEVVKRIDRRLDFATNLDVETAEELQVQNYGVGGHYEPHLDCSRIILIQTMTLISLQMTEPEIGGRTIFIDPKTSVPCTKHAALFWYNLMRSGEVDMRSRHAACPVLTGMKWTANKWFHEEGQEWRRPCGLNKLDEERYLGDLGAPEPKRHLNIRSEAKKMSKKR
uniref:procollagen-proline 4-dioxygenase n=1 Tax=Elaeophora elaphi TaxID=1147741 RepID=A0A0R3RJE5_9BILA